MTDYLMDIDYLTGDGREKDGEGGGGEDRHSGDTRE